MTTIDKLSARDVERLLTEFGDEQGYGSGWSYWAYEAPRDSRDGFGKATEVPGLGDVQMYDTYTGGEGGGEDAELVFKIGDRYFQKQGYYASFDGTHWDGGFFEVVPALKTITVFHSI